MKHRSLYGHTPYPRYKKALKFLGEGYYCAHVDGGFEIIYPLDQNTEVVVLCYKNRKYNVTLWHRGSEDNIVYDEVDSLPKVEKHATQLIEMHKAKN